VRIHRDMKVEDLAGLVCHALSDAGIIVTLTGGACVSIWSEGRYVSDDLDLIESGPVPRDQIRAVLGKLGFSEHRRHFTHPDTKFFIEFPNGPLMVGHEQVTQATERETAGGRLRLLSPTDCVKDRLAAFYHWRDTQSLEQALLVAKAQTIDLAELRRWSKAEKNEAKFKEFVRRLR
jgi:hypothetical protein